MPKWGGKQGLFGPNEQNSGVGGRWWSPGFFCSIGCSLAKEGGTIIPSNQPCWKKEGSPFVFSSIRAPH